MIRKRCLENGQFSRENANYIYNNLLPANLRESALEYGLWLLGDPELDDLQLYQKIQHLFPKWPYELKAYGSRFLEDIFVLTEAFGYDESHPSYNEVWFNLLRSLTYVSGNRVADLL